MPLIDLPEMQSLVPNAIDNTAGNTPYVDAYVGDPNDGDEAEMQSFEYKDDIPFVEGVSLKDADPSQRH